MNKQTQKSFNALETFTTISIALDNSGSELLGGVCRVKPRSADLFDEDGEKTEMSESERQELEAHIRLFSEFLGVSRTHTLLFVALYSQQLIDEMHVTMRSVARFMGINNVAFVKYRKEFEKLESLGLVQTSMSHRGMNYCVSKTVENAIEDNKPLNLQKLSGGIDRYGFCKNIGAIISRRDQQLISTTDLFEKVENEEMHCAKLRFVKQVKKILPDVEDRTLFYRVCDDFINEHSHDTDIDDALSEIYEYPRQRFKVGMMLKTKENELVVKDLVKIVPAIFFSDSNLKLTEKGMKLFLEKDSELFCKQDECQDSRLVTAEQLAERKLFFDSTLSNEIVFLKNSLMEEQFVNLQQRLEKNSMPKGVAALFYGYPGTGKTATAEMIAKATGRSVYHVDIADSKSMWFGESEKIIKKIFTDYQKMCKSCDKKPILLFNEADALFSKRRDVDSSRTSQTENAIQNILLEEMEKMDGILIATTNLCNNLDKAFSRRFLFKIKFEKPNKEAKTAIWKSKLPWLADNDCADLAARFELSGGEIDNIVRKATMEEVLTGNRPTLEVIKQWCGDEKINDNNHRIIGFAS